uniref:Uncharacterized protein isoform X2 n=1 Tax=Nicotiana tabacum TaxID=4097 RepID=A0A1S3YWA7_TOBAC|nr:PREDICTED: uncharacterized protein LOC107780401 isoform X2 [Nicotiana tabacum]
MLLIPEEVSCRSSAESLTSYLIYFYWHQAYKQCLVAAGMTLGLKTVQLCRKRKVLSLRIWQCYSLVFCKLKFPF